MDLISRQAAIKALHDEIVRRRIDEDTNDDGTLDEFDTEEILRRLPSVQPKVAKDTNVPINDLISRQGVIEVLSQYPFEKVVNCISIIEELPSAQPEITDGQAIEHLQSTGWMQNHDKQMYEMGLKEQLADDSGSYDSLIPSAQPESKREWYMKGYRDAQAVSCTDLCVDCPLFDHEKHECPRFNRVIPRAIEEVTPRWIPVTPDSPPLYMPVLTWDGGTRHVEQRIPYIRDEYGEKIISDWWIDGDEKWDEWAEYQPNLRDGCAIKWMPLPEAYKEGQDD